MDQKLILMTAMGVQPFLVLTLWKLNDHSWSNSIFVSLLYGIVTSVCYYVVGTR
jgi:hypothetical protein